ncbi:MAG: hypothetical protein HC902_04755 [Calothrix sp. SM1_5_4]|nr:hypothetical protein [Calothrix sp. SM1_5_4]
MIPDQLLSNLNEKLAHAVGQLKQAEDVQKLYDVKVAFAGKQGFLSEIMREMRSCQGVQALFGKEVNRVKDEFEAPTRPAKRNSRTRR